MTSEGSTETEREVKERTQVSLKQREEGKSEEKYSLKSKDEDSNTKNIIQVSKQTLIK